jgi:AraC-like DNA-binding protein
VAFESGFEDLSHFHHVFKTVYSCSPLKFRKQSRSHSQPRL